VALPDRESNSVSIRARALGEIETEQPHEVLVDVDESRNSGPRVVLRSELKILSGGKPLQILGIEVGKPHIIANDVPAGSGVLFLPDPFQTARRSQRAGQDVLHLRTDGAEIRLEMRLC